MILHCNPPEYVGFCHAKFLFDPLEEQDDFGRGLYLNAIRMVEQYLVHCSACGVFG